jgi:predicted dehydrogenase
MTEVRVAVVGAGYLGRFHAQKYAQLADCRLVGIADPNDEVRSRIAAELAVPAHRSYRELVGQVDAVSVVTPTPLHFEVAAAFLRAGAHVLVEKPITATVAEAAELIAIAREHGRILQVGHLERFNPAILALEGLLTIPRFIESHRLAPFKQRGTDVSVVLDLMIHDIDLIQDIVREPVATIEAVGAKVFSDDLDIANARLRFAGGCVANVTASRVSLKQERKLRLFQDDAYLSVDLQQKILTHIRKGGVPPATGLPPVTIEERSFDQGDALLAEITAFLDSVRTGKPPVVSGEEGLRALDTATRIAALVRGS